MSDRKNPVAEIIAVGDEMTSGQRLDTNTQWLARQLNDLGIEVAFHSTVGDDMAHQTEVIRLAMQRADLVLMTGGLGPTKDDLTRQAIADAAGVELEVDKKALAHIESIFERNNRTMSPANRQQANVPTGGQTIHNEEGTAPGVDFTHNGSRIFAMPGVPYEMKLMWESHVAPEINSVHGDATVIRHRVLRCFGIGESQAESMMPDLIDRDREPKVGITASYSIISFRISAKANSEKECLEQISATESYIRETLGNVVFGSEDETLGGVTANLLANYRLSVSFVDFQFGSAAANMLRDGIPIEHLETTLGQCHAIDSQTPQQWLDDESLLDLEAVKKASGRIREQTGSDIGIAIGRLIGKREDKSTGKFPVAISFGNDSEPVVETFRYGGHSSMRVARSANQVVDLLRLALLRDLVK